MRKIFSFQNIVFALVAVYLVYLLVSQQSTLSENMRKNAEIKQEIGAAEQKLEELENEAEIIDTREYIEKRAREELGYVYSDEIVYIRN